ncbi:MAG TPA: hypothetical protein DHV36_08595 [Desulfobacteraceae bacterium]|nr:hypothetical protein [Desulfobacteraceae bacterium]
MIFNVQITTPELLPQKNQLSPTFVSGLKHGQVLSAKVMTTGPGDRAQLNVAGQNVSAKTDLPLTPGTTLSLLVNRGDNGLISLRLTPDALLTQSGGPDSGATLGRILQGFDQLFPQLGKTDNPGIKDILNSLALRSGSANKDFLPNLIENVGITLENKVAGFLTGSMQRENFQSFWQNMEKQDLKAAVLSVIQNSGDDDTAGLMKGAANTLESFQQFNHQSADSNRFLIPFPILIGEQFDFGQLLINTGKEEKKGEENRVIKIAFLMNMSALGGVRADFSILNKAITGRFLLEDQETRDYMAGLIPELTARLSDIDYKATRIECQVGTPKDLSSDALVQSVADPMTPSGFNVVI